MNNACTLPGSGWSDKWCNLRGEGRVFGANNTGVSNRSIHVDRLLPEIIPVSLLSLWFLQLNFSIPSSNINWGIPPGNDFNGVGCIQIICSDDVAWVARPFCNQLGMVVVYPPRPVFHSKKLACCCERQGHSDGSFNQIWLFLVYFRNWWSFRN